MKIAAIGLSLVMATILGAVPVKGAEATNQTDAIRASLQVSCQSGKVKLDSQGKSVLMSKQEIVSNDEMSLSQNTLKASEVAAARG